MTKNKQRKTKIKKTVICQFCNVKFPSGTVYLDHLKLEHTTKLRGLCQSCYSSNVEIAVDVLSKGMTICVKCAEKLTPQQRQNRPHHQKMKSYPKHD